MPNPIGWDCIPGRNRYIPLCFTVKIKPGMIKLYTKRQKFYLTLCLSALLSCNVHAQQQKSVFVIVHGAWGGSWGFRQVDSLMTEEGCIVYRPSLTGLGERVHLASSETSLTTHIKDVVNTVLFENLYNIILVGHSYGGMVITGVADSIPERIRKLVYLDAMVPDDGESVMKIMDPDGVGLARRISGDFLLPARVEPDQKPPMSVPHPLKTFTEPISLKNEKRKNIPVTYILTVEPGKKATEDAFAKFAARAEKHGWEVWQMAADHTPQRSALNELVKVLLKTK